MWSDYLFPRSLEEAVEMLATYNGSARIIAGGTDLVLQAQRGQCDAQVMVDITAIPGLDFLEEREGWVYAGPQVTHGQVAASPLIREKAGVLASACGSVGGPQLRQVATLVGNVVNALPAADGAVALFALDAEVQVIDQWGRRWESITGFYKGVGQCGADPCHEVVGAIRFRPLPKGSGWDFQRLARRRTLILPMLCAAMTVRLEDGAYSDARIAIGPVAPIPFRATAAENALRGSVVGEEVIGEASRLACEAAAPRDSLLRGSGAYRKQMVEVLVRRGLLRATARAQGVA